MSKQCIDYNDQDGVVLCAYHKKLKTMKKKYFVLYRDTLCNVARLEYYDNEKKFRSGFAPKKSIKLKNCFNINQRMDTKYNFVIALSTRCGGFGIVVDSENEMNTWLNNLLSLHLKCNSDLDLPHFDHVWQVIIQKRGIAEQKYLFGNYHICLTNKAMTLIKITSEKNSRISQKLDRVDVLLTTIRRCGDSQCYFYMEIGRQSTIGPGELWMQTEDPMIAKNMHIMILNKMISVNDLPTMEPMRKRSSSATEASKPLNEIKNKMVQTLGTNCIRERCDSLPSRNHSVFDNNSHLLRNTNAALSNQRFQITTTTQISPAVITYSGSEGSSISNEESDDVAAANFLSLRLCTRGSNRTILEESSEDPLPLDEEIYDFGNQQQNQNITEESEDKYLAMAPMSLNQSNDLDGNSILLNHIINSEMRKNQEFTVPKDHSTDLSVTRSNRTYSLGNRTQHSQLQILKEADESSSSRVRALSVGSKTSTHRNPVSPCIHPKLLSTNSSLSSIMAATSKKSISAPLLINKYSNNSIDKMDKMSDLMELDFSKHSPVEHANERSHLFSEASLHHNIMKYTPAIKILSRANTFDKTKDEPLNSYSSSTSSSQTDNGYLEMRPICLNTESKSNSHNFNYNQSISSSRCLRTADIDKSKKLRGTFSCVVADNMKQIQEVDKIDNIMEANSPTTDFSFVKRNSEDRKDLNSNSSTNLNPKEQNFMKKLSIKSLNGSNNYKSAAVTANIAASESNLNEICIENENCNSNWKQLETNNDSIIEKITKSSAPPDLKTDLIEVSSSSQCNAKNSTQEKPTKCDTTDGDVTIEGGGSSCTSNNENYTKKSSTTPPANNLYYASLDLPACNRDYAMKTNANVNLNMNINDSTTITLPESIKNVYAKIDFDHSETAIAVSRKNS